MHEVIRDVISHCFWSCDMGKKSIW